MVIRKTVVRNINVKIASTIFRKIMFINHALLKTSK